MIFVLFWSDWSWEREQGRGHGLRRRAVRGWLVLRQRLLRRRTHVPDACQISRRTTGNSGEQVGNHPDSRSRPTAGQNSYRLQKTQASQSEGSAPSGTCRPSSLALIDGAGYMVEAGEGAVRHTRAWTTSAPAIVAGCRRLGIVPQPCQMQGLATANTGGPRSSSRSFPQPTKWQLGPQITQPLF